MDYLIPISKPYLTKGDFKEIKDCFDSSWISSKSPWVDRFEKLFAKEVAGSKYAISVNSGTSAIFVALKALNIGIGDEVILPSFTMIATINAVIMAGATPVIVDSISSSDWSIDPKMVLKKITNKTRAIIPVHIYGYLCHMDELLDIAKAHKLYVIEDAAEAMGGRFGRKLAGGIGDVGCFSLYSNKVITTGNGGIITTSSKELMEKIKRLRFFDFNKDDHFVHNIIGYNLVMSGLQAALGVSQVSRFRQMQDNRTKIFEWYKEGLGEYVDIFSEEINESKPSYWLPAILLKSHNQKNIIVEKLKFIGIETRNFFLPIHRQPAYSKLFSSNEFNQVEKFYRRGLLLPSYFGLSKKLVKLIISTIRNNLK